MFSLSSILAYMNHYHATRAIGRSLCLTASVAVSEWKVTQGHLYVYTILYLYMT